MAEPLYRVALTGSFMARLASIEALLEEANAALAHDDLLTGLRGTVIPNLARFPLIGKRYLDQPPQSAEALKRIQHHQVSINGAPSLCGVSSMTDEHNVMLAALKVKKPKQSEQLSLL